MRLPGHPTPIQLASAANEARMAFGVPLLAWDPSLAAAALAHAEDLRRTGAFSHDGSDGSNVSQRVRRSGGDWRLLGENLAMGATRPAEAITAWLESPAHRDNLLDSRFVRAGAAVLALPRAPLVVPGYLWVQVYGTPAGARVRMP